MAQQTASIRPIRTAGIILGLGFGGFFDGIVFHQILQWHHLVSEAYPPTNVLNLQINTLWDGLFHAASYVLTGAGLFLLWWAMRRTTARPTTAFLIGAMLTGWGLFNLVEGIINHHILQIHHVRTVADPLGWDIAFLVWGAAMVAGGVWLTRDTAPVNR